MTFLGWNFFLHIIYAPLSDQFWGTDRQRTDKIRPGPFNICHKKLSSWLISLVQWGTEYQTPKYWIHLHKSAVGFLDDLPSSVTCIKTSLDHFIKKFFYVNLKQSSLVSLTRQIFQFESSDNQKNIDHWNTGHVWYSNPHCITFVVNLTQLYALKKSIVQNIFDFVWFNGLWSLMCNFEINDKTINL